MAGPRFYEAAILLDKVWFRNVDQALKPFPKEGQRLRLRLDKPPCH